MKKKMTEQQKIMWFEAIGNHDIRLIEQMVAEDLDINTQNMWKENALFDICKKGYKKTAQLLLNNGININATNDVGWAVLHDMCHDGYTDISKLLIDNGADINMYNKQGKTPLMVACSRGNVDIIKLLLKHEVDFTLKDKEGKTAFQTLKIRRIQEYEELMEWITEHHPEMMLEIMASDNTQSNGVGL